MDSIKKITAPNGGIFTGQGTNTYLVGQDDITLIDPGPNIQEHVENNGFSIVRSYVGHGIGRNHHDDPQVPNFVLESEKRENSLDLVEGLVIAIEPMVNVGNYDVEVSNDNWTVVTKDGSLSAHFEHTIAITKKGPVNLTK